MSAIRVIASVYGSTAGAEDVTAIVQQLADQGTTSFTAGNGLFGDPSPGTVKHFMVSYQVGRTRWSAAGAENDTITLAVTERSLILSAVFGSPSAAYDVTATVQGLVDAAAASSTPATIAATDATFGDPSPNIVKHFAVSWRGADGTPHQAACQENESVTIA